MKSHEFSHLYVHIPFCDGKCSYCAFYSEVYTPERADQYLDALAREFDLLLDGTGTPEPKTVYFGGGTSSSLDATQLEHLCEIIASRISTTRHEEWSMEANPGSLSSKKIGVIKDAGINRISMGAQSFDDEVLERIGRRHTAMDISDTVKAVRSSGIKNIGLDLIACLPGVYDKSWRRAVEKTVELKPQHVSVYALTIERSSQIGHMVRSGDVIVPDDDLQMRSLDMAEQVLETAGYEHYEISNYSLPEHRCAHNVSCWQGEDYLGLGPAASSRAGRRRWTNQPNIDLYVEALSMGEEPPRDEENLEPATDATERLIFAFRLSDGVDIHRYAGEDNTLFEHWDKTLKSLVGFGLVEQLDGQWALTKRGRSLADFVAYELINV